MTLEELERWTFDKLQKMVGFPPDEIIKFIFSMDNNSDIETYLADLLGTTLKSRSFVETLIKKINLLPRRANNTRVTIKTQEAPVSAKKKAGTTTTKKHIASFSEIEIKGRAGDPCDCQATRHPLITNCLNCGKVICEQEEDYFANANNKWISEDERRIVAQQEKEHEKRLEDEKRSNRVSFDFVAGRIVPAASKRVEINNKMTFAPSSNLSAASSNTLESLASKDNTADLHYVDEHRKGHMRPKAADHNKTKNSSLTQTVVNQYYGAEDDMLVLGSKEVHSHAYKFSGLMEGLWHVPKGVFRLPVLAVYSRYIETMARDKSGNCFILAPYAYAESPFEAPIPQTTLAFLTKLSKVAQANKVSLNVALRLPAETTFGSEEAMATLTGHINAYKSSGITAFTIIMPADFNESLAVPICAPSSAVAETSSARAYSVAQVTFVNELYKKHSFSDLFVCPSFFEIDLRVAPSRTQIEYWREISKGLNQRVTILFSTPCGRLDPVNLAKINNIFDKRSLVVIEKFPNGGGLDPYRPNFVDSTSKLAGIVASPFNTNSLIDGMVFEVPLSTFFQYLKSSDNYQPETTLRANLLEMTGTDALAESFSDLILALSDGVLEQLKGQQATAIDGRTKVKFTGLVDKANRVKTYYSSQSHGADLVQHLNDIIKTLNLYIESS
eukprot:gene8219-9666_t